MKGKAHGREWFEAFSTTTTEVLRWRNHTLLPLLLLPLGFRKLQVSVAVVGAGVAKGVGNGPRVGEATGAGVGNSGVGKGVLLSFPPSSVVPGRTGQLDGQ